jgi:hypothetical protein
MYQLISASASQSQIEALRHEVTRLRETVDAQQPPGYIESLVYPIQSGELSPVQHGNLNSSGEVGGHNAVSEFK